MPLLNYLNSRHFQTLLDYHRDQWSMTINTQKDSLNMNMVPFALLCQILFSLLEVQFLQEAMTHAARLERWPGLTSKNLLKLNYYKQANLNLNWKGSSRV